MFCNIYPLVTYKMKKIYSYYFDYCILFHIFLWLIQKLVILAILRFIWSGTLYNFVIYSIFKELWEIIKCSRMLTEIDVCLLNCRLEKQFLKVFPGMMSHGSFLPLFPSLVDLPSEFPICLCNQWFAFSLTFFCSTTLPFH